MSGDATHHAIDRRRFLLLAAAVGLGAAVGCSGGDGAGDDGADRGEDLDPLLEACAVLAAAVTASAPGLAPLGADALAGDDADAVRAAAVSLREAIAADFVTGDTVDAGGWVLATTEARLVLAVVA